MVNTSDRTNPSADLQEVANRHDTATATAAMAKLGRALDTIPLLSAEIRRLDRPPWPRRSRQPRSRDPVLHPEGHGQGAVRSQMDVRISFRVRERKDADLILGQGMLVVGWHAHTLNAPGEFLISAAEHDTPREPRAYLLTDQAVEDTATYYAAHRLPLDPISQRAIEEAKGNVMCLVAEGHQGNAVRTMISKTFLSRRIFIVIARKSLRDHWPACPHVAQIGHVGG